MQILISILMFVLMSFATFYEQGTMSTDDTRESRAEASLSGVKDVEPYEAQEEEVRIEDDEYDPNSDPNTEIDEEKMQEYQNEVQY